MTNVLVIGASSGIGLALTNILAANGNIVYATFNSNPTESSHSNVSYYPLDVRHEMVDLSFLPDKLDGLVYCPGSINLKPFQRIKPESFIDDFELQVVGAIKVIQTALPKLKAAENASVVLFSTIAVKNGFNFHSQVSTSKGAIEGLGKALAAELAPNIRVNIIAPSLTQTPLAGRLLSTEEKIKANADRHPLKRIGQPKDLAEMASFLLSEKSSWITGQVIHVDGGKSTIR